MELIINIRNAKRFYDKVFWSFFLIINLLPSLSFATSEDQVLKIWNELFTCMDSTYYDGKRIYKNLDNLSCIALAKKNRDNLDLSSTEFKVIPTMIDYYYNLAFNDINQAEKLLKQAKEIYWKETRWTLGKRRKKVKKYKTLYSVFWKDKNNNLFTHEQAKLNSIRDGRIKVVQHPELNSYLEFNKQRKGEEFRFPPPLPSIRGIIPQKHFSLSEDLYDIQNDIITSLQIAGYGWRYSIFDIENGFVLNTFFEKTDELGYISEDRWNLDIKYDLLNPIDYLKTIFISKIGYFRSFTFVVTKEPFNTRKSQDHESLDKVLKYGYFRTKNHLKSKKYTQDYSCHLLIYEYRKTDTNNRYSIAYNSALNFKVHMNHSGLLKGLERNLEEKREQLLFKEEEEESFGCFPYYELFPELQDSITQIDNVDFDQRYKEVVIPTITKWAKKRIWFFERTYKKYFYSDESYLSYIDNIYEAGEKLEYELLLIKPSIDHEISSELKVILNNFCNTIKKR